MLFLFRNLFSFLLGPVQQIKVADLNVILKSSATQVPISQVLRNRDMARISVRQMLKMGSHGVKLGGYSGDTLVRLTARWPEFLKNTLGVKWKAQHQAGYIEMDKIFENWIEQILDSPKPFL